MKAHLARFFRGRRREELPDGIEEFANGSIMGGERALEFGHLGRELLVLREQFTQPDKRAHDGHTHRDGARTAQDAREHRHALLGENPGLISPATMRPGLQFNDRQTNGLWS